MIYLKLSVIPTVECSVWGEKKSTLCTVYTKPCNTQWSSGNAAVWKRLESQGITGVVWGSSETSPELKRSLYCAGL